MSTSINHTLTVAQMRKLTKAQLLTWMTGGFARVQVKVSPATHARLDLDLPRMRPATSTPAVPTKPYVPNEAASPPIISCTPDTGPVDC